MRKTGQIIVLFIFSIYLAHGQSPFGASTVEFGRSIKYFEMGGGAMLSSMGYLNNDFSGIDRGILRGQSGELALRVQYKEKTSFSTRVSFRAQGATYPASDNFRIRANYITLFMPFEYDFKKTSRHKKHTPSLIVFVGPWLAYRVGGNVKSDVLGFRSLEHGDINSFDSGVEFGTGVRIPTFSFTSMGFLTLKVAYQQGLFNSFPQKPNTDAAQMQKLMLASDGYRYNHGIRLSVNFEMSLVRKKLTTFTAGGDGRKTYKRFIVP